MENFIEFLYSKFLQSDGVSTDTRTIEKGNLFFGLNGPSFRGAEYANIALEKGANFAVVDDQILAAQDERMIYAPDTLSALQELAVFHRSKYKRVVLGLTGSNGKTTTKELITAVLKKNYIVHATPGNYNNHIGVPLTLLHIHPQVEMAIIEMGANHVGEIAQLCEYALPTHGLITNIGHAHTEGFGGFEGVIRGKSELFDYLKRSEGEVFINLEDKVLSNMAKRFDRPHTYQTDAFNFQHSGQLTFELAGKQFKSNLVGAYNAINIAAAIEVGRRFNVSDEIIGEAIASYAPDNMRSQLIQSGDIVLILDAYNANPDSMKVAIENLGCMEGKRIAILGDMKELDDTELQHKKLGEIATEAEIDMVYFVGKDVRNGHKVATRSKWFATKNELVEHLVSHPISNATVLIKASRSAQLETLKSLFIK
ncbi:MAG: UDP-N-acetylmuramoyl-tripeptide--D-alanyl-D-alanine ligase [Cyclobacteriaceae bacterium]